MRGFEKFLRPVLLFEDMTFDQLFRYSEPKRVKRSLTVRGPPLEINGNSDAVYHIFNFKSFPSTTGLRHHGYVRFKKPKGNPRKPLQHIPCEVDCSCFAPGTPVLMSDGTYKAIENIRIGDTVYTHKGRVRRVLSVRPRAVKHGENVYELEISGFPGSILVTGEHPFYALRGNEVCLCGCGLPLYGQGTGAFRAETKTFSPDLMLAKKYRPGHSIKGQRLENTGGGYFDWIKVNDFRPQEWFLSPWLEEGPGQVDPDLARLLGYYVAEGCLPNTRGRAVRLTFNQNEWDTLVADVVAIARKLGYVCSAKKRHHSGRHWVDVSILSKEFKEFCRMHAGQGSLTKRLSVEVMSWNNRLQHELFTGMVLGDGWCDPERGIKYLTSNFDLAAQAALILSRLKVRHTVSLHAKEKPGKRRHYQVLIPKGQSAGTIRAWLIRYQREKDKKFESGERLHRLHYSRNEGQLRGLRKCVKTNYTGLVYDLTIEEDASFIVCGVAVHNCPDFRYRFAWADKQRGAARIGVQSMNQCINRAPRKTNPGNVPGLCKHILATRDYIYGMLAKFPGGEPDTGEKLAQLVQYANKRWANFDTLMAKAKDQEKWYAAVKQAANQGQAGNIDLIYDLYQRKGGQFIGVPAGVPPRGGPFGPAFNVPDEEPPPLPPPVRPPRPPRPGPVLPAAGKPTTKPPTAPALAVPPGQRGRGLPPASPPAKVPAKPPVKPAAKPPALPAKPAPKKPAPAKPALQRPMFLKNNLPIGRKSGKPAGATTPPGKRVQPKRPLRPESIERFLATCVSRVNGSSDGANDTVSMKALSEAIRLIEEIEHDEVETPSAIAGEMAAVESPPPSEPPVSDDAVGADTEGNVVLQLLADIKDLLSQLVGAEEGEGEFGPEGELPPGEGSEEDRIPVDAIPEPDEDEDEEEKEEEEEGRPPRHKPEGEGD